MSLPASSPPPTYEDPATLTSLRPYLTLPYLISLTWLAYPILSILFVVFRLQLSLSAAENAVSDAKATLLASCLAAEQSATATASLPRYMAIGTNKQIVDAVNSTLNGSRDALILALTAMEAIVNFFIDGFRSSFLCFLELVIHGGLSVLIAVVQELQKFVQLTMSGIRTAIQANIDTANAAISSAVKGINKSPFGPHISLPRVTIPSLSLLDNITLSSTIETTLTNLNSSVPSIQSLRHIINGFADTPFELLKTEINNTFRGYSFNASVFSVPQTNTVSFCNHLDTGIFDKLGLELIKIVQIGTIMLIILAVLLLAFHIFLEWYKWRSLRRSMERTRGAWSTDLTIDSVNTAISIPTRQSMERTRGALSSTDPIIYHVNTTTSTPTRQSSTDPTIYHVNTATSTPTLKMTDHNLLTLHATSMHPTLTRLANTIAARYHLSPSQLVHLRFFFHYVFHPPAVACFIIGLFGILSVELQLLALVPLQDKLSHQSAASSSGINNVIAASMDAAMRNQSIAYANDINAQLTAMQNTINNGVFGWVNTTTTTLNNSLVHFYNDVQNAVNLVFGRTIFASAAQGYVQCMIGSKVQSLENVLTFLNANIHVNLPLINESALILSPAQMNEATQPISAAAVGSGGSGVGGVMGRVVARYMDDLQKERLMFAIFMLLWCVVVFGALCIIFWHSYAKAWFHWSSRKTWQREQREGFDTIVRPRTGGKGSRPSMPSPQPTRRRELVSFTPLSSSEKTGFFAALKKWSEGIHWPRLKGWTIPISTSWVDKLTAVGRGQERLVPDQDTPAPNHHSDKGRIIKDKVEGIKDKVEGIKDKVKDKVEVIRDKGEPFKDEGAAFEDRGEVMEVTAWGEGGSPWWRRVWNRWTNHFESDSRDQAPLLVQRRTGVANLTIATNRVPAKSKPSYPFGRTDRDGPPGEEIVYEPASAWSVSPAAKPAPWIRPLPAFIPLRQKPKPLSNAAIPQLPKVVPPRPIPPIQRLSIPIHYGFVQPRETEPFPKRPTSPVHQASSTLALLPEIVQDPFATCFDDEYRVESNPPAKHVVSAANPFRDAIGTPRAV